MTVFVTPFHCAGRLAVALFALCLTITLDTQPVSAQAAPIPNRFLFIIDTSSAMKPFDKGIQDSLFDLIYSGGRGRMTNGDTYGLWLVNEQNDMSFKMEVWRQRFTVEMGARAALHVKEHGFRGQLDMNQAMDDVLSVVKNVGDLTIILISNGETPLCRTPFDESINARFRELAPVMKRKKATLNTVLVAQDGNLVAWAVNSPDYLVEFPSVPAKKPAPIAPPLVESSTARPTNASAATSVSASKVEPAKARANVPSIIITKDTVAQERRHFLALASTLTNEPSATSATTEPVLSPPSEAANAVTPTTNLIAAAVTPAVSLVTTSIVELNTIAVGPTPPAKVANTTTTHQPMAKASPPATKAETTSVTATIIHAPPVPAAVATPVIQPSQAVETNQAEAGSHPLLWVAIGAGAAFVCMLSVLLVLRRRRPEPSLVSQAILRERMRAS